VFRGDETDPRNIILNESLVSEGFETHTPMPLELLSSITDIAVLNSELVNALDLGYSERVRVTLEQGADPNFQPQGRNDTLLMTACYNGDTESVLYLLEAGADPNRTVIVDDSRIITPLMIAAESGMTEAVAALLQHSADPHVRTALGDTALLAAARSNNHDAFAVLVGSMVRGSTPPMSDKVI
jgi:uncharacterized protein